MIKTFKVQAEYNDMMYVLLQVDTDKLTPEQATYTNDLYGPYSLNGGQGRIEDEDGDVVRAVVRLFGALAIQQMLLAGGACFKARGSQAWRNRLEAELALDFSSNGIRVIEAQVEIPDFDTVELCDIPEASA